MPTSWPSIGVVHVVVGSTFAMPQSRSFTLGVAGSSGLSTRNTLSSLRSRWTTPAACAAISASQTWSRIAMTRSGRILPSSARCASDWPSSRSITMYGPAVGELAGLEDVDDVRVTDLVDDLRLEQHAVAVEARRRAAGACTTLSAARLPISSCTTAYTAPMPPRPSSRSTSHGPALAPGQEHVGDSAHRPADATAPGGADHRLHAGCCLVQPAVPLHCEDELRALRGWSRARTRRRRAWPRTVA